METEQLNFQALKDLMQSASIAESIDAKEVKETILDIALNLAKQHLADSKTLPIIAEQSN